MRLLLVIFYVMLLASEGLAQKQLTSERIIGEWKIVHYPHIKEENQLIHHSPFKTEMKLFFQPGDTLISFNKKEYLINNGQKKGKYKIKSNELFLNETMYLIDYHRDNNFRLSRIISEDHVFRYFLYRIK